MMRKKMSRKQTPLKLNSQAIPLNPFRRQYSPKPLSHKGRFIPDQSQAVEESGNNRVGEVPTFLPNTDKSGGIVK